mgnify:CR=1 FL=1
MVGAKCHRAIGAMPVFRHHLRRQCIEEQGDVRGVLGERRDRVGVVGEGDQRHLAAGAFAQQGGIGDHHQLVWPVPLGYLQHQVRAYAGGLTRRDGKTMAVHLLIAH